ncbi:conserved hypothetical protein [Christiangramia forsetii KT0803]|uniref:PemK-like protein n=1 Tax=Christiangramia forsetii (strain DSM 17595 / CGMCC 1.15422 / KT0803) TaxID=411154 RepID=A0M4H5_CHRFK|nr:conserved hypothetical protein [Christiangramia forsetii KT0803]
MRQGEIWEFYLDQVSGREQGGRRPAIIISGNLLNQYLDVVIVCPLTTSIKNYKGNLILKPNNSNGLQKMRKSLLFISVRFPKTGWVKNLVVCRKKILALLKQL